MRDRVLDAHVHCLPGMVPALVRILDAAEVEAAIVLSRMGEGGPLLEEVDRVAPDRLRVAVAPDVRLAGTAEWDDELSRVQALAPHAAALKLYKEVSFGLPNREGRVITFLSPELDPLWRLAAEAELPVIHHCADPADFWRSRPVLRARQLELRPESRYAGRPDIRTREQLLRERAELVRRHPDVRFVGAHLGGFPEDLDELAEFAELMPLDTSAALEEILVQGAAAVRAVLERHDRRVLWGSDLILAEARSGRDAALVMVSAKYVADALALATAEGPLRPPDAFTLPWAIEGLALEEPSRSRILWENANATFSRSGLRDVVAPR